MSTINLPPGVPAYQPTTTKVAASPNDLGGNAKEIQDNFLKMLMAQIQNQNPLDPAKPSEFTSQLSQLNTMKGITDLNANVQSFLSQLKAADFMSSSQVVGRNALVPGNQFDFAGMPVVLGGELSSNAVDVRATITDELGKVIDEVALGSAKAGPVRLQWDGAMRDGTLAAPGSYRLQFQVVAADGENASVKTYVPTQVASVGREGDAVKIRLADGQTINAGDVIEWLK